MINTIKLYISSLKQDIKKLDVLIDSLEKQYQLLSQRDTQLQTHNELMLTLLEQLNTTHQHRELFIASIGLPEGKEGLRLLCEKLPEPVKSHTTKLLQELTIKSKLCKTMNERSGQLLANQRQLMQRLTGAQNNTTYPDTATL